MVILNLNHISLSDVFVLILNLNHISLGDVSFVILNPNHISLGVVFFVILSLNHISLDVMFFVILNLNLSLMVLNLGCISDLSPQESTLLRDVVEVGQLPNFVPEDGKTRYAFFILTRQGLRFECSSSCEIQVRNTVVSPSRNGDCWKGIYPSQCHARINTSFCCRVICGVPGGFVGKSSKKRLQTGRGRCRGEEQDERGMVMYRVCAGNM